MQVANMNFQRHLSAFFGDQLECRVLADLLGQLVPEGRADFFQPYVARRRGDVDSLEGAGEGFLAEAVVDAAAKEKEKGEAEMFHEKLVVREKMCWDRLQEAVRIFREIGGVRNFVATWLDCLFHFFRRFGLIFFL